MGDRVSISFRDESGESPVLFNHWGGVKFAETALAYARQLSDRKQGKSTMPLDRLQADTVMVDFIRETTAGMSEVESSLYLGKDGSDGDNSDNGHYCIVLDKDPKKVRFDGESGRISDD